MTYCKKERQNKFRPYLKEYGAKRKKELTFEDSEEKKVTKGAWGMPRLSEAKKDVISCEKLRGLAHTN